MFLCDTQALFRVFAPWNPRVGGVTQVYLGGNAFLRPFSIERGRLIGPSGDDKPGERTLAYFIAHEVTHTMTGDHTGRWRYHQLAAFQAEGYADYVAFARPIDFTGGRPAACAPRRARDGSAAFRLVQAVRADGRLSARAARDDGR